MSLAIIFGSTTGYTEELAYKIYDAFEGSADLPRDIHATPVSRLLEYQTLVLGVPTWNHGQLQSDWAERFEELEGQSFAGRKVAFFGSGDAKRYPEHFQDAMGILWRRFEALGAELIGTWPVESYSFEESQGLTEDGTRFVGLAFERHDSEEVIEQRIKDWVAQLRQEMW